MILEIKRHLERNPVLEGINLSDLKDQRFFIWNSAHQANIERDIIEDRLVLSMFTYGSIGDYHAILTHRVLKQGGITTKVIKAGTIITENRVVMST